MPGIERIGVSLEKELLADFDALITSKGYQNRSEAVRDLIRSQIDTERLENPKTQAVAAVIIAYSLHLPPQFAGVPYHAVSTDAVAGVLTAGLDDAGITQPEQVQRFRLKHLEVRRGNTGSLQQHLDTGLVQAEAQRGRRASGEEQARLL